MYLKEENINVIPIWALLMLSKRQDHKEKKRELQSYRKTNNIRIELQDDEKEEYKKSGKKWPTGLQGRIKKSQQGHRKTIRLRRETDDILDLK